MEHQHKILVVDGDNDILSTYKEFFKKRGFIVEMAHNGIQGLEKLRHRDFSVALVALKIPQMNGIKIIKMAKEEEIETKIVILSGEGDGNKNDGIVAVNIGVSAWFEKSPSIMGDLLKKVKELSELMSFDEIDRFISSLPRQN